MSESSARDLADGLHPIHVGQLRQILDAAAIDPAKLSTQGRRILRWLAGWDGWTTDGLAEILTATRTAAQVALHRAQIAGKVEALRVSDAAMEAAFGRYDGREEHGHDLG
jgi:hypothetical protein